MPHAEKKTTIKMKQKQKQKQIKFKKERTDTFILEPMWYSQQRDPVMTLAKCIVLLGASSIYPSNDYSSFHVSVFSF